MESRKRWTFPGFRAVASQTHANWAQTPIDSMLPIPRLRNEVMYDFLGHVHSRDRGQRSPSWDGVDFQHEYLIFGSGKKIDAGERRLHGLSGADSQVFHVPRNHCPLTLPPLSHIRPPVPLGSPSHGGQDSLAQHKYSQIPARMIDELL